MNDTSIASVKNPKQIEKMRNLFDEILQIQKENKSTDEAMRRIGEIVKESSTAVENSTSPNEMIVDAKILQTGAQYVGSNVSSLNTNLTSFDESKYIKGLVSYIKNSNQIVPVGKEWDCFGKVTYKMFKKCHPLTFMLGTFTFEPPPEREKHQRDKKPRKLRKVEENEKNVLSEVTEREKANVETESDVYDHILKYLVRAYKKNNRRPVNYFKFIIDPTDYWKTIENIFHFAFLVRDGSAKMSMEDELPVVEPVLKMSEDNTGRRPYNNQFCFKLGFQEWKECVKRFEVVSPSVPPFISKA